MVGARQLALLPDGAIFVNTARSWVIDMDALLAQLRTGRFQAAHVYLVMTSTDNRPRQARIEVNGRPIAAGQAGSDVHNGAVTVRNQRLYSLISLPHDEQQTFTIQLPPGISAYDFTFG